MQELKLDEILKKLKNEGVNLSKRTFEYYQRIGLLPKPARKKVGKGGRGVYGYYSPVVVDLVKQIVQLKEDGNSLAEILDIAHRSIFVRYKKVLKDWGFSEYTLPELTGQTPFRELEPEVFRVIFDDQDGKIFEHLKDYDRKYEILLAEALRWWLPDESIEAFALEQIVDKCDKLYPGMLSSLSVVIEEREQSSSPTETKILTKVGKKITEKIDHIENVKEKAMARLSAIAVD